MAIFEKIIELSKLIAASLLKDNAPKALEDSEIFNEHDKDYILKNLTEESLINERLNQANKISNKADWKKVKAKIDISSKNYFWRYAAAAIIIALFSTNYLLKNQTDGPLDVTPVIVKNTIIEAGSNKATLQLEDGSIVALEKGKSYHNKNLNTNGEKIILDQNKVPKKDIVYNYLTIPRGGQFFIQLPDSTKVWLNSESQLKFPVAFIEGETRKVELIYGEAYFDVSSSLNHKGSKFKVLNKNQEIEVSGTEFNVKAYKDEKYIYTTLVEGKVAISNGISKQNLVPEEQSILNKEDQNVKIVSVDVDSEISWKRGIFMFRDKPLNDVMKVISRWYDVDIIIENKRLEDIRFKGVLGKDQNLEELLFTIKNLSIINNYEIHDRKIIIN
jgi:transmembrane sensor